MVAFLSGNEENYAQRIRDLIQVEKLYVLKSFCPSQIKGELCLQGLVRSLSSFQKTHT